MRQSCGFGGHRSAGVPHAERSIWGGGGCRLRERQRLEAAPHHHILQTICGVDPIPQSVDAGRHLCGRHGDHFIRVGCSTVRGPRLCRADKSKRGWQRTAAIARRGRSRVNADSGSIGRGCSCSAKSSSAFQKLSGAVRTERAKEQ